MCYMGKEGGKNKAGLIRSERCNFKQVVRIGFYEVTFEKRHEGPGDLGDRTELPSAEMRKADVV